MEGFRIIFPLFSPRILMPTSHPLKDQQFVITGGNYKGQTCMWVSRFNKRYAKVKINGRIHYVAYENLRVPTLTDDEIRNLKPYRTGEVYVCEDTYRPSELSKVGRSKDAQKRVTTLQTGNPFLVLAHVEAVTANDHKIVERVAHRLLAPYRLRTTGPSNEFFRCATSVAIQVVTKAHELVTSHVILKHQ